MLAATLITGLPGAGKSRLIEAWREAAHPQKAIAVLSNGSPVRLPSGSGAGEVRLRSPRFGLGRPQRQEGARESGSPSADPPWLETLSGCLCCTARAALPAVLARLQKRGPWDHLLIELNGAARPAAFIDLLRSPALASHVRLVGVIAVVDARLPLPPSTSRLLNWPPVGFRPSLRQTRSNLLACATSRVASASPTAEATVLLPRRLPSPQAWPASLSEPLTVRPT
mgnify:CR=1 FL=1